MRGGKGYVTVGLVVVAFLFVAGATNSLSSGITRQNGLTDEGCICHGPNGQDDGVPNANVSLLFNITKEIGRAHV